MSEINSLAIVNHKLSLEWHPTKNKDLTPNGVTPSSGNKVWWLCSKNPNHEWEATVDHRSRGTGCPFCAGKKTNHSNCLATFNPNLVKEWHHSKNDTLTPYNTSPSSNKKAWWLCSKNSDHEWMAMINSRNKGSGCPFCVNQKVYLGNSLATINPKLSLEWHPTKNGSLTPNDILPNYSKKVWWVCSKNPVHEWVATANNRTNGRNCPYCAGKKVNSTNSLATINPQLEKEWHQTKNKGLDPKQVTTRSGKKVWWKCLFGHEWEAVIASRHEGRGCPKCNKRDCSLMELSIYYELKWFLNDAEHLRDPNNISTTIESYKKKLGQWWKLDIFIPSLLVVIEYDGVRWHKEKNDMKKNKILSDNGLTLIRIREKGLKKTSTNDLILNEIPSYSSINFHLLFSIIYHIINVIKIKFPTNYLLQEELSKKLTEYQTYKKLKGEKSFREIWKNLPIPLEKNSLFLINPTLSLEWHSTKNKGLDPKQVTSGSGKKAWWLCSKDKNHEWEAVIGSRHKGAGCPYCSGRLASHDNNLLLINPQLAKEWHPSKNENLTPNNVLANSSKKVWWKCNSSHEWKAKIANRNLLGNNCPKCFGRNGSYKRMYEIP